MPELLARTAPDTGSIIRTTVLVGALLALGLVARDRMADRAEVARDTDAGPPCPEAAADCGAGGPAPPGVVAASDVCLRAGYLCAGFEDGREIRIARWNEDTGRLRIRVPLPQGVEPARARALQEAAARGIRAWHGRPFDLRVDLSERQGRHDFVVTWSETLGGRELGRTRTRWVRRVDGRADLEVREFALATRNPWQPDRDLPAGQVELTAAHEMGHALGLPHSDEPRDVMYPENTATRLTARDYITMSALYGLENGAVVR